MKIKKNICEKTLKNTEYLEESPLRGANYKITTFIMLLGHRLFHLHYIVTICV